MPNLLALSGAQPNKPTRFSPIYTGRWSSGLWTNRSPLRDANTTRLVEKFYGPSGDALIDGLNCEITNRLTLARRPGLDIYDSNTWNHILTFYEFHLFSTETEKILIMVDQPNALYSLFNGIQTLVFVKSAGAAQTSMQSVGNTLYFGDKIEQKKWQQSITTWNPNTFYALGQWLVDPNGNIQRVGGAGTSGAVQPTWSLVVPDNANNFVGGLTIDSGVLWSNMGTAIQNWGIPSDPLSPMNITSADVFGVGPLTTANGGWTYCLTLVNTVDGTSSNAGPLTVGFRTGNNVGFAQVSIPPGTGIDLTTVDPQVTAIAIFRTTDGGNTYFFVPPSVPDPTIKFLYTVNISTYKALGFTDTNPDYKLNNQLQPPLSGQNTPPLQGATNLTFHLNRIFFSIGNIVYWTAGPDTPFGNGVNGVPYLNFQEFPSLIVRILPTGIGALVFTVSDTYIISGLGTASSPIQSTQIYLDNLGLANYNALDTDGTLIGLYTTDKQFLILDPNAGTVTAGFPIGNLLRLNNGGVGTSWNPVDIYVVAHTEGEDHGFYIGDGNTGWYRLMPTPAPEIGYTWSPFAELVGGCTAIQSVEIVPGTHKLLVGPKTVGPILNRNVSLFSDFGTAYEAYSVIGSAVLAQPGQVAQVSFITTDSVKVGDPLELGVILDEALPYFTGSFDILHDWVPDPPDLKYLASDSLWNQRFYLAESENDELVAVCRHLQVKVDFGIQSVQNELLSLTIFGAYSQEC